LQKRRVVVTGLGTVSPLGLDVASTWHNACAGVSGVQQIEGFDVSDINTKIAALTKGFDASLYLAAKEIRSMDTFVQYGIAAAHQALQDSQLTVTEENQKRIGVALGSGIGGLPSIVENQHKLVEQGPRRVSPFFIPGSIINMVAGYVSIKYKLKGPNISIVTACTTGTHNIGYAARTIAYGDADVMVAGGSEMATCRLGLVGFSALRALSTRNDDPIHASRPWDKDRDGFVLGDGAAVLILEEYEHAKARGATIYAELVGFGMSADAYHITAPDKNGFIQCMHAALDDAKMNADEIDYVNAHATSTPLLDPLELDAIKVVIGDHKKHIAVSSTKSMTGHLLGAAGSIEALFSVLAIRDQIAPPTMNLENPDEGCDDVNLVANEAQQRKINTVLSNSFGFGGTNGTLIFKSI